MRNAVMEKKLRIQNLEFIALPYAGTSFNPLTALLQRKSIREVGELIHSQSFKSKTYCLNALEGNRTLIMHLHSKLIDTQKDQYIFILMGLSCMATKYVIMTKSLVFLTVQFTFSIQLTIEYQNSDDNGYLTRSQRR